MKRIHYIIFSLLIAVTVSCTKKEVMPVDFDVAVDNIVVKVGDSVSFNFVGNPYFITFYSGEKGHKYEYRDRTVAAGSPYFSFTSLMQYGNSDSSLKVYISTDFSGSYTRTGVDSAHWTNVTGSAVLSTTSNAQPSSGNIDLSAFTSEDNKPIYIAFYYADSNMLANKRTWTISNFIVNNVLDEDGSTVAILASAYDAGFTNVSFSDALAANYWIPPTVSTGTLKITGGAATAVPNKNMAVSKPIVLSTATPDVGVAIKEISATLSDYTYQYSTAGVYTVTFVASNENIYGQSAVVKTIQITVEE